MSKTDQIDKLEKALTFGEQFNFNEIYRIKGKPGLYNPRSEVSKSNMVNLGGFLNPNITTTVNANDLICLNWYDFITTEPAEKGYKVLKLNKVFDNIFNYIAETNDFKLTQISIGAFKEMAVPNFDDNQFKDYHAELIKKWYLEIVELLKVVTTNKENEIITELNNGE